MVNKYVDMEVEQIKTHWQDFANVIVTANQQQWETITVLPEESWALSRGIAEFFALYKIGVQFQVFPLRPELVDESPFHGIILELKRGYENDVEVILDRKSYIEFAHCVDALRSYAHIAMKVTDMYEQLRDNQEDGV